MPAVPLSPISPPSGIPRPPLPSRARAAASGGMATVYLVQDLRHARPVALKLMNPELAASGGPERFLREIQLAARLDHPHILPVYDSGEDGRALWYVMPYVEGGSLRDRLRREGRLPVGTRSASPAGSPTPWSTPTAADVIHRDIKPENILLAQGHARLADFGVARARGRGHGRGADPVRPRGRDARSTWRRSRPAARRWISGATSTRSPACSTRCSPATALHRRDGARHHRPEHAGPGAAGAGRAGRGAGGARGADHPEPLRRAGRPLPLGVGLRREPGGQPHRAERAGVPSAPRPLGAGRAGAGAGRLPAPRLA